MKAAKLLKRDIFVWSNLLASFHPECLHSRRYESFLALSRYFVRQDCPFYTDPRDPRFAVVAAPC